MSCWYYPGCLFDSCFGLPCVAWCGPALCCPLPFPSPASPELPSPPACLPASALEDDLPFAQQSPSAKLLCKGRSMGWKYPGNGKGFLRWSHVLEIKGEYQTFLRCSTCRCVVSLNDRGLMGERGHGQTSVSLAGDCRLPCSSQRLSGVLMPFLV